MTNMVDHPEHYTKYPIEVIDMIREILTIAYGPDGFAAYCLGNEIKYRMRAGFKGNSEGDHVEDLNKALKYAEFRSK